MDKVDHAILNAMQEGISLLEEPFLKIAKEIEISQDEVIARLRRLIAHRVVKRFGVSINHKRIGITANAVVAWKVPQRVVEEIGHKMSSYQEITHCYERKTIPKKWEYNLYTVVHGYDREEVKQFIKEVSNSLGVDEYVIMFSSRRFKRSSVTPKLGDLKRGATPG